MSKKLWALCRFENKTYGIVSENWFNRDRSKCHWPSKENSFTRYKTTKCCKLPVEGVWEWFNVERICVSGITDFKDAEKYLNEYESCSDSEKAAGASAKLVMPCISQDENVDGTNSKPIAPTATQFSPVPTKSRSTSRASLAPVITSPPQVPVEESPPNVTNPPNVMNPPNATNPPNVMNPPNATSPLQVPMTSPAGSLPDLTTPPHRELERPASLPTNPVQVRLSSSGSISKRSLADTLNVIFENQEKILNNFAEEKKKKKKKLQMALPNTPMKSEAAVNSFAASLSSSNFRRKARHELQLLGGKDARVLAQKMLSRLMDDDMVQTFSWKGQQPSPKIPAKKSFKKSPFATLILLAVRKCFPNKDITEANLQEYLQDWIIQAKFRQKKRAARRSADANNLSQPLSNQSSTSGTNQEKDNPSHIQASSEEDSEDDAATDVSSD